jgi:hypothetical protein
VHYLDDGHVALSCQFFNKTRRNLDENPLACVELYDPLTLQAYRLRLKFLRSEKTGPLFDAMSARIEAIASATGMKGIFRLIAADVFEVLSLQRLEGYLAASLSSSDADAPSLEGYRSEVRGLQWVSERINRSSDLESLLGVALEALEEFFQFSHTSVLLYDEACDKLITLASRGYEATGIGAGLLRATGRCCVSAGWIQPWDTDGRFDARCRARIGARKSRFRGFLTHGACSSSR